MYDPAIGRWHSVDPLAVVYESQSPFSYVLNNPIKYIDPNGMWVGTAGGYTTDDPEDIKKFLNYLQTEKELLSNNPDINEVVGFVEAEENNGIGKLSDDSFLTSSVSVKKTEGKKWYQSDMYEVNNDDLVTVWTEIQKSLNPQGLVGEKWGDNYNASKSLSRYKFNLMRRKYKFYKKYGIVE
jgi:uncharacterized protein RhaS with RHS repeats